MIRNALLALLISFGFSACHQGHNDPELPQIKSSRISMDVGDLTTAVFRYNPKQNEKWTIGSYDEAVLTVVFDTEYAEADTRSVISQKGVMAIKFEAMTPGVTSLLAEKTNADGVIIERRRLDFTVNP